MTEPMLISERDAWLAVLRAAGRIVPQGASAEARLTIEAIATSMLEQLGRGVHANPRLEYARALGARIRAQLAGTREAGFADRLTHHVMTGRMDRVTGREAQRLYDILRRKGHPHVAGQWATFYERTQVRG